jgi:AraC-like DNA-binding protein
MLREPLPASSSRRMCRRDGIGDTAHLVQHARLLCRRLAPLGPGVVLVRNGRKHVRHRDIEIAVDPGDLLLIPDGVDLDVINEPSADAPYQALALNFDSQLVRKLEAGDGSPIREIGSIRGIPAPLRESCERAMAAIVAGADLPDAVAAARVGEVLLWLAALGHRFEPAGRPDMVTRLRKAIDADPSRPWRATDAASLLCMSEPSLRRHLAAAGTSFSALLIDVRMSAALGLLQSTDRSVTTIALDVGYDSASRFAARFRARFDFTPSAIRGHRQEIDRNGTESDRACAAAIAAE